MLNTSTYLFFSTIDSSLKNSLNSWKFLMGNPSRCDSSSLKLSSLYYPGWRLFVVYCTFLGSMSIASASFTLLSIYLCFLSHGLSAPFPVFVPSLSVAISSGHSWRVQVFSKEIRFVTLDTMAKSCIATAYSKICCDLFVIESPYISLTGKS